MSRLIDADALPHYDGTALSAVEVARAVIYAPTIEKRKKGKWILLGEQRREDVANGNFQFVCSECGKSDLHSKAVTVSFCWNCGADMREEQDNG